jgi:hypothetical protein
VVKWASGTAWRLPAFERTNRVAPGPAPTSETPLRQVVAASRIAYTPGGQ